VSTMRLGSICLTVVLCANARGFSAAQTAQEVQQRVAQLQDATTSDEASVQLKALGGNNPDARLYLAKELPGLISKTSQNLSQDKIWSNCVHLAGELKIEETVPVLVKLFDPVRYSGSPVSTMTSRSRFDADPVAKALVNIGQPTIGPVSEILEDKDKGQHTRMRAALVLYKINSPNADTALTHDLRTETDPRVRSLIEARLKARRDISSR
jgi:hypothetical protein